MLFCSNDTATTEIYPLPLHDALPFFASRDPIDLGSELVVAHHDRVARGERVEQELGPHLTLRARPELLAEPRDRLRARDRKSTRLNSSHSQISYAVFCLKEKN